jgi:hypothetical protein
MKVYVEAVAQPFAFREELADKEFISDKCR